ncbi:type IV inositol polyphosphate 5-phosphatase 9-like [Forsythia ovata]|uniref:Type IV inositol polyphosphate 5-phosphatase 9-like n=1 Tax=Forsythia ovata TaxID=205694 RepID=A0ABD1WV22_9LAMI
MEVIMTERTNMIFHNKVVDGTTMKRLVGRLMDQISCTPWTSTFSTSQFQEIVPLNAGNILGSENSNISTKWNALIKEALNKRMAIEGRLQNTDGGETPRVHPLMMHNSTNSSASDFQCIISKQMVGIYITIWVRNALRGYISYPSVSCVGCGLLGCLGNKLQVEKKAMRDGEMQMQHLGDLAWRPELQDKPARGYNKVLSKE